MIICEYLAKRSDNVDICETYSTENFKLKQEETDIIYGSSVIDVIEGYDDDGKPFSRYTYTETDEKDEESEEE